ncbi:cadherin 87A [Brevipalpus obovatus]|uniref:cadherin 87A n=1 Tax=Brevipalpus obovatus TaxID=246614 RepID=UPI003D9E1961
MAILTKHMPIAILLCLISSIINSSVHANRPPIFTDNLDLYAIDENAPINTPLGSLRAYDPENSSLTFSLDGTDFFNVDKFTGLVTVKKKIDREKIGGSIMFHVSVEDRVTNGQENNRVRVPITVLVVDENDNPPYFDTESSRLHRVNISEDAIPGTVVVSKMVAKDDDLVGSILRVRCERCSPYFSVNLLQEPTTNQISFSIVLVKTIDFETTVQSIVIEVIVTDGSFDTSHRINVNVLNVQNKPPIFIGPSTAVISEDMPIGSLVMTIKAVDGDAMSMDSYRQNSGPSNRAHANKGRPVVYELVSNPQDCFKIDLKSGELRVASKLDKEAFPSTNGAITLIVKAYEVDDIDRPYSNSNDPMSSTLTSVIVTLQDVNDEAPKFNKHEYHVSILEGVPNGTPLASLDMLVEDRDTGPNSIFNIALEDPSGMFSVEPPLATGSCSVSIKVARGPLDYENPNQRKFILVVRASEAFTKEKLSSTATVTVTIEDVNDNPPMFDEEIYVGSVLEDALAGTIIKTIKASDRDSPKVTSLTYSLVGNGADLFSVHLTTGVITIAECETPGRGNCLDYETRSSYHLSYQANDGFGQSSVVPLTINVMDSNDNPPMFVREKYFAVIDEGAVKFEPPLRVKARDADVTSIITYSILSGNHEKLFSIEPRTGEIKVNQEVRSKSSDKIMLKIQASDGGKGIATVDVEITIRDANDNSPHFEKDEYLASVSESAEPGTIIEKVAATDADSGQNAEISYRIEKGAYDMFTIDPDSGIVKVAQGASLDYDRKPVYRIQIVATDKGVPVRTGSTLMIVKLINDNDKSPYFYPTTQRCQVNENTLIGTRLHQLNATDPDAESVHSLVYRIESVQAVDKNGLKIRPHDKVMYEIEKFFRIDADGFLVVSSKLNRDIAAVVTLNVSVTDISSSSQSTQIGFGSVIITLIDHNDHPPVFSLPWTLNRPEYIFTMIEEQPIGTAIANIMATDVESKISRYTIEPPNEFFDINEESGVITVKKVIDYEALPESFENEDGLTTSIRFHVFAYDAGIPQLSSRALITVNVININDNEPIFEQSFYNTTVPEDAAPGTEVIRVVARDADRGKYGLVSFSIISQSYSGSLESTGVHGSDHFIIDQLTGVIRVAQGAILDREKGFKEITLQVAASDTPSNHDNPFEIPSSDSESHPPSSSSSSSSSSSRQHQSRLLSVPVYITISDVNDNPPSFSQQEYEGNTLGHFDGSSSDQVPVLQVSARDPDEGLNGKVVYKIVEGNLKNIFSIDSYTGVIYAIKSPLDANPGVKEYKLKVEARDMDGETPFFDQAMVRIKIVEMNRNKPKFLKPGPTVQFLENQKPGTKVVRVEAYDEDNGINGLLRYSFKKDTSNNVQETDEFRIDPESGVITSKVSFDREERSSYELVLSVEDYMSEPVSFESLQKLTIMIKDMDDNRPEFSRSANTDENYHFLIPENRNRGTLIGKLTAIDRDEIDKKVYYYIIDGNSDNAFFLEKTSGQLYSNTSFDREECQDFFLVVKASSSNELVPSSSSSQVSSSKFEQSKSKQKTSKEMIKKRSFDINDLSLALVHVTITDLNDNKPVFSKPIYRSGIHYRSEIGRIVPVTLKAVDLDAGSNSSLVYTISSIDLYRRGYDSPDTPVRPIPSPFSISQDTGKVVTTHLMAQYPVGSRFVLAIEAREKASPHRTANCKLYLWVYDESKTIRVTMKLKPEMVNGRKDEIEDILSNATEQRAIINDIKYHYSVKMGKPVKQWSDVYVLIVDDRTFTNLSPNRLISKLDSRAGYLRQENQLAIEEITLATSVPMVASMLYSEMEMDIVSAVLLVLIILLAFGFLAFMVGCCCLKSWYSQKLVAKASKAALKSKRAMINGSSSNREMPRSIIASSIPTSVQASRMEAKNANNTHANANANGNAGRNRKNESHSNADKRQQVPRSAISNSVAAKDNPLWTEGMPKFYEEQELSFRVSPNNCAYNLMTINPNNVPIPSTNNIFNGDHEPGHYASLAATLRTKIRQRQPNFNHDNHEYHELQEEKSSPTSGDRVGFVHG